jgi:maleamate amidohydrolase
MILEPRIPSDPQARRPAATSVASNRLRALFPIIPDEDLARLDFYTSGDLDSMWGLGQRPATMVIDMTTGFIEHETASTFVPTGLACARSIDELLRVTRAAGIPTIYTRGTPFRVESEAGGWLRGRGMEHLLSSNSDEHRTVIAALRPREGDPIVVKAKHSAFYGTQLQGMLNYMRVDSLIVTGVTTSGCIRATVNDAFALNYRVVIPIECVADRSQVSHQVELFDMAVKYADVLPLSQVVAGITEHARRAHAAAPCPLLPKSASRRSA